MNVRYAIRILKYKPNIKKCNKERKICRELKGKKFPCQNVTSS